MARNTENRGKMRIAHCRTWNMTRNTGKRGKCEMYKLGPAPAAAAWGGCTPQAEIDRVSPNKIVKNTFFFRNNIFQLPFISISILFYPQKHT